MFVSSKDTQISYSAPPHSYQNVFIQINLVWILKKSVIWCISLYSWCQVLKSDCVLTQNIKH